MWKGDGRLSVFVHRAACLCDHAAFQSLEPLDSLSLLQLVKLHECLLIYRWLTTQPAPILAIAIVTVTVTVIALVIIIIIVVAIVLAIANSSTDNSNSNRNNGKIS